MVTTMKHFDRHLKRLRAVMDGLRFRLEFKPGVEDEMLWSRRVIRIDSEREDSEIIATLLHEIGHVIAFMHYGKQGARESVHIDVIFHKGKPTRRQTAKIIEQEEDAWRAGEQLAFLMDIPLGSWYAETRAECLKSYREYLK